MSTRFRPKLHVKTGDTVVVVSGNEKGKQGKVLKVLVEKNKALVEGLNIVKRHTKGNEYREGGIFEKIAPIHISNLALIDSNGKPSRVGRKEVDGKSVRYLKTTKEIVDK